MIFLVNLTHSFWHYFCLNNLSVREEINNGALDCENYRTLPNAPKLYRTLPNAPKLYRTHLNSTERTLLNRLIDL